MVRETLKEDDAALPEDERTFVTSFNMKPNTESVFLNGLIQAQGATKDYVVSGVNKIIFNTNDAGESFVETSDEVVITYIKG